MISHPSTKYPELFVPSDTRQKVASQASFVNGSCIILSSHRLALLLDTIRVESLHEESLLLQQYRLSIAEQYKRKINSPLLPQPWFPGHTPYYFRLQCIIKTIETNTHTRDQNERNTLDSLTILSMLYLFVSQFTIHINQPHKNLPNSNNQCCRLPLALATYISIK